MNPTANQHNGTRLAGLLACLAVALVASPAFGVVIGATGQMTVDGQTFDIPIGFDPASGQYGVGSWDSTKQGFTGWTNSVEGQFNVQVSGALDPDPAISYGIAVTDFGAPSAFGFAFGSPIVLGPGPTTVDASVVGGLTDFTGDGVSITPTGPLLQTASVAFPTTSMGVDVGIANVHPAGPAGSFYTYGSYAAGPIPGPPSPPWTFMTVGVNFLSSGGGDTTVLTGFAEINPFVPEPSSVILLAMSAVGLVLFARRRRAK